MMEKDGGLMLPSLFPLTIIYGFPDIYGELHPTLARTGYLVLSDGVVSTNGVCGTFHGASSLCCGLTFFGYSTTVHSIFLWMVLALGFLFTLKQFVPKKSSYVLAEATEAETLTAIEPGKLGRVLFEGNSWQARCEGDFSIPAHSKALVVGRQGNTLLVLPEDFEE